MLEPELTNTFYYKTKLFRGYKYRYQFNVGDQFVVDNTKPVSEDRTGRMTNTVGVPTKEEEEKDAQEKNNEDDAGLDAAIEGLQEEENKDEEEKKVEESAFDQPQPPQVALERHPTYVADGIGQMLPKDIQQKQGTRVMDNTRSLTDLLKQHASSVEDIKDMEQVAQEAEQAQNFGVLQYMQA